MMRLLARKYLLLETILIFFPVQMKELVVVHLYPPRYHTLWNVDVNNNERKKIDRLYRSFPSTVITNKVEPASPHGCHAIFAIGGDELDA
jgi:hypothetical protein